MYEFNLLQKIILWGIPILFAITVHEVAHGWVANKLGDPTAKILGRLTLNPIKHIDLLGTIIIPALLLMIGGFIFGWAKPVPITWGNLKKPKRDMALVGLAGPMANLLMALLWAAGMKLGVYLQSHNLHAGASLSAMSNIGISINMVLMILNLLPIPPLDGARVLSGFLPGRAAYQFNKLEPFGFFIILVLLATGLLTKLIYPAIESGVALIYQLFGL